MKPTAAVGANSLSASCQALEVEALKMASPFWSRWLFMVTTAVMLFGLALVLAPGLTCEGWQIIAVSVAAWFIPDTTFSLWSGSWQNAVLYRGGGTRKRAYQLSRERNHRE